MFFQIAVGAVGIGVVLMIGYLVVAQVINQMPTGGTGVNNISNITAAMDNTKVVIIAGFGLVAVGIIVLAAFGLIQVFQ